MQQKGALMEAEVLLRSIKKKLTKLKQIFSLVFVFLWNIIKQIPEFTEATNQMHFVVIDIYYYCILLLLNNIKNVICFLHTQQKR